MAVMAAYSACIGCRRTFCYDPHTVPSIPVDPVTGLPPDLGGDPQRARREPICPQCCRAANVMRRENNLPPFPEGDSLDNLEDMP